MSGFIDPNAPTDRRIERLELLVTEILREWDTSMLSPEARAELDDLASGDEHRRRHSLLRTHARMAADPLPGHKHDDECDWDLCPHRTPGGGQGRGEQEGKG